MGLPDRFSTPHTTSRCPRWRRPCLASEHAHSGWRAVGCGGVGGSAVHGAARRAPSRPLQVCGRRALSLEIFIPRFGDTEDIQAGAASLYPAAHRRELRGQPLPWTQKWGPVVGFILSLHETLLATMVPSSCTGKPTPWSLRFLINLKTGNSSGHPFSPQGCCEVEIHDYPSGQVADVMDVLYQPM